MAICVLQRAQPCNILACCSQEVDRHEDLLRSCLRAVEALNRLPGAESHQAWQQFMKRTVVAPGMKERFLAVEKERAEAEGLDGVKKA